MKKIILSTFILFGLNSYSQNTIPTTTVNGTLKINDSLNVNKNIIAKGEVIAKDTVRAKKDVKVEGNVSVAKKLTVEGNSVLKGNVRVRGELIAKDTVHAEKDVIVDGNANIDGNLKVNNNVELKKGFTFDGSRGISFTPATSNMSNKFHYGNKVLNIPEACASAPQAWANHQFGGMIQLYNADQNGDYLPNGGLLNFQTWTTGGSSIDASVGGETTTSGNLLLNWFCGNDVSICQGNGGVVGMGKHVEMGNTTRNMFTLLNMGVPAGHTKALSIISKDLNDKEIFQIKANGATYIGTERVSAGPHTDALLTVSGKVACKEVRVFNNASGYWSDFVFDKNYKLMPLAEVESYYKSNKHLPNIPTAKQIEENGNDLAKTDALLLQKIEELTLYIVQQQKEIEALKKAIKK